MRRVSIVGTSGSGKSTLGRALAERLGVPFVELDSIHHQPGWTPLDPETFRTRIDEVAAGDGWVVDGNYGQVVRDGPIWKRADTVVWLDLPRAVVMGQVIKRSGRRVIRREELWNGNRESLSELVRWDPERSIIRWAWTTHGAMREEYARRLDRPGPLPFDVVRLTSRREAAAWLSGR